MDIKEIQNLIKFVSKSGVNEVSLEQGEFKITIKTEAQSSEPVIIQQTAPAVAAAPVHVSAPSPAPAEQPAAAAPSAAAEEDTSKYITVKSPMIGTFYRRPAPGQRFVCKCWRFYQSW